MPPVFSLPFSFPYFFSGLSDISQSVLAFPIRIPLPGMKIGSILPGSFNEPLKESLLALFKLAWSNRVQLPVLITVAFLALDIRLQLEINVFWEPRRQVPRPRDRDRGGGRAGFTRGEATAIHNAVVAAAILRRRRMQDATQQGRHYLPTNNGGNNIPLSRLAMETIETDDEIDSVYSDGDIEGYTDEEYQRSERRSRPKDGDGEQADQSEDEEDSDLEEDTDDDDNDFDDTSDDDNDDNSGGTGGFDAVGWFDGGHGYFDHDHYDSSDDSNDDDSGGTPLVVELELRNRPLFNQLTYKVPAAQNISFLSIVNMKRQEMRPTILSRQTEIVT